MYAEKDCPDMVSVFPGTTISEDRISSFEGTKCVAEEDDWEVVFEFPDVLIDARTKFWRPGITSLGTVKLFEKFPLVSVVKVALLLDDEP